MVIENFKPDCYSQIYDRLHTKGRMLPTGLIFVDSWANAKQNICFQLMQTHHPELFKQWISQWEDLIDFKIYPIEFNTNEL